MAIYFRKINLNRLLNSQLKSYARWPRAFSDKKENDDDHTSSSSSDDEPTQTDPQKETAIQASGDIKPPKKTEQQLKAEKAKAKLNDILASLKVAPIGKTKEPSLELSKPEKGAIRKMRKEIEVENMLEPDVRKALDKVAAATPDASQTRDDLLSRLMSLAQDVQKIKASKSVNDILVGIKIDPNLEERQREHQRFRPQRVRMGQRVNLYSGKALQIFSNLKSFKKGPAVNLPTWNLLAKHEVCLTGVNTPSTPYEEMIQWTEKGMMWKYPIDNEQGMEREAKVGFDQHVFLEPHLEEGFPKVGPVRDFMELVCVGLSQNPYISVHRKLQHIQWFREYFAEKASLLEVDPEMP